MTHSSNLGMTQKCARLVQKHLASSCSLRREAHVKAFPLTLAFKCLVYALFTTQLWTENASAAQMMTFVVQEGDTFPHALIEGKNLKGGLTFDLQKALGQELNRDIKNMIVPRKRMANLLETGEADVLCFGRPEWFGTTILWSKYFIPYVDVLVARQNAKRPANMIDLANVPVGTVNGYSYPEIEKILGPMFIREVAPSPKSNLAKLAAGRMDYAVTDTLSLAHFLKTNAPTPQFHDQNLVIAETKTACALSKKSAITLDELNSAIDKIVTSGKLDAIFQQYR
jgi:polar amino acid transport system substrate-binding protein